MVRFADARLASGPTIRYAEQGEGEPVVLLHGWPDSWFSWSRILPLLSTHFRVIAPDQRGFGDSSRPHAGYAIDDFAADAVALLDALSIERAAFVGHSFGSFVARRVAIRSPERVSRLALIGTAVSAATPVVREVRVALDDLADPVPAAFARDFQQGTVHVPLPPEFFERIIDESLKLPARLWRAVLDGIIACDDAGALARIAAPTLLLWGEHDALFPREDQHRLLAAIPGSRLVEYPGTGHCPNWEVPAAVATDIEAFLRQG